MKKITKSIFYLFIFLIIIISSLGLYVLNLDLNKYKANIEEVVEKNISVDLVIDGDIEVSLLPNLEVVLNDVSLIKHLDGNKHKLVSLEKVEAKLALLPLLKKEIIIPNIYLKKANIVLEKTEADKVSWDVAKKESIIENRIEKSEVSKTIDKDDLIKKFKLKNLSIIDSSIKYIDVLNPEKNQFLSVNDLHFTMAENSNNINLDLDAIYNEKIVKLLTSIDLIPLLINDEIETPIDIKVSYDNIDTDFSGKVVKLNEDYSVSLDGDIINPRGNYNLPKLAINTKISYENGKVIFDSKDFKIAEDSYKIFASADLNAKKYNADIKISGDKFDYRNFVIVNDDNSLAKAEKEAKKGVEEKPEFVVPYALLNQYNAKFSVDLAEVVIDSEKSLNNLKTESSLENGMLRLPVNFEIADGLFNANINVNSAKKLIIAKVKSEEFILPKLDKKLLVSSSEDFGFVSGGKTKLDISLKTIGEKLPELKSALNGRAVIILNESEIETGKLSFFDGNIIGKLIDVIPFLASSEKEKIDLQCAVIRTDIINGVAKFPKSIVFSSKKNNLVFDGDINLKNQKLKFMLNPYSNRSFDINVAQVISSFIRVSGSLSKPEVKLAEKKAALKTWTGVLTSGLSIAGEQLLLQNDTAPCYSALKNTKYQNYFPAPKKTVRSKTTEKKDEAVVKINKEVDRVVDDAKQIIKGLESLF